MVTPEWHGDNPFYLLCVSAPSYVRVDLDEKEWAKTYADWMRKPGEWHLIRKEDQGVALSLVVHDGEQPYYTSRVFGNNRTDRQVRAYGIGKKLTDNSMVRIWILENGLVCGGDDIDEFGPKVLDD